MLNTREMAYPALTKGLSWPSPDTPMLFAPFECAHPPLPVPPFLLMQTLSPKDIAGDDIMKLKIAQRVYVSLVGKGLKYFRHCPAVTNIKNAKFFMV